MRHFPRTMSTQHPDNANTPFFAGSPVLSGEDEVQEAYYVFSHLGVEEQMWDCEGKEVDTHVVRKLITRYPEYFSKNILGRDEYLTLRVPNPEVEKAEAKLLIETLESIPRSFDAATLFYDLNIPPIFEVILPMTTSSNQLQMIADYYTQFVSGKESAKVGRSGVTIKEWIGEVWPKSIEMIPLIEDAKSMINIRDIVKPYIEANDLPYLRVFLARSDPALNYGMVAAVILIKLALMELKKIEKETGVPIFPILGVGSVPFRGHFTPYTVESVIDEYSGCQTFTIQSAFKFDNPVADVIRAINVTNNFPKGEARDVPREEALRLVEKTMNAYRDAVPLIAPVVNKIAKHVPSRRLRKLHIGLFGYARTIEGIQLPRAITYCAALYSVGLPPELIGLNVLDERDLDFLKTYYPTFERDLNSALAYFNPDCQKIFGKRINEHIFIKGVLKEYDENHRGVTSRIIDFLVKDESTNISKDITEAAFIRKFLG